MQNSLNVFLSQFYTVFDMTPVDEDNENFIQIFIGKINKKIDAVDNPFNEEELESV